MTPTFQDCCSMRGEWHSTEALKEGVQPDWGAGVTRSESGAHTGKPWSASQVVCELDLQGCTTLNCLVGLFGSPGVTVEIVEILISVFCWTDRKISLGKGTGELCPQTGKVTNPNVSLPYKERSLNGMTGKEVMNGPAGENEWRPALPDGTGISITFSYPGSPGTKNQMGTLGWWYWGVSSGILHFGFQEILVPFSQMWVTGMSLLLNVCGFRNLHGLFTSCWKSDLRIGS